MREGRERVVGRSGRRDEEGGKRKQGRGAKGRRDGESRRGANVREAREGREAEWGDGATRQLGGEPGDERCTPLRAGRGIPTPGTHRRVVQGSNPTRPARDTNCNTATSTEGNMTLAARGDRHPGERLARPRMRAAPAQPRPQARRAQAGLISSSRVCRSHAPPCPIHRTYRHDGSKHCRLSRSRHQRTRSRFWFFFFRSKC